MNKWQSVGLLFLGLVLGVVAIVVVQKLSADGGSAPAEPSPEPQATITEGLEFRTSTLQEGVPAKIHVLKELSPETKIAASRFRCVCGCPDDLLSCSCQKDPGGITMKNHLQDLVEQGLTNEEIDREMVKAYGEEVLLFFKNKSGTASAP